MKPILIVEDDEHIAKMIAATLSIGGYTSEICEDGERAVTLISERDYDLVLLDVMLPGLDGFSVIQRIQSDKTPVIFLTAVQDVADKVRGLRLGAEDYIVKPFEAVELLARVEGVLRRTNRGKTQMPRHSLLLLFVSFRFCRQKHPLRQHCQTIHHPLCASRAAINPQRSK